MTGVPFQYSPCFASSRNRCQSVAMRILDSHVHFFDPARPGGVDWPAADSPLYRRTLPEDLISAAQPLRVAACIAVETSRRAADDEWLLALAANEPLIAGCVLNLQPDLAGFEARLNTALQFDKFVGVRLRPIESYDLSSAELLRSFSLLQQNGRTIEFGATSPLLKTQFADLAQRFPETTLVLDHCGHPDRSASLDNDWLSAMEVIAANTNVAAKVTGLGGMPEHDRLILEHLVDLFGVDRLLFGSNWPVCPASESYGNAVRALAEYFDTGADAFFYANCRRVYGLG